MKLAAKLIFLFLVGVLGIVSLFSWQILQRQSEWDRQLRETHAKNLVETLDPAITTAYRDGGVVTVQRVVEISTQKLTGPHMRWIDGNERSTLEKQTLTHRVSTVFVAPSDDNPIGYSYVPLVVDGKDAGAIEVAIPMEPQAAYVRASLYGSILSLLGVAILSASVIFLGGIHWVGKPLKKLVEQVNTIGQGNFPQPAVLSSSDELGRLAKAISQMSYRLSEQRDTIRHTDRIGTIGTLAAGVAHELGTPLNVVSGRAGLIANGKLSVAEIEDGVAEKLLSYSWPGNVRELRNVVERAVALTRYDKITVEDLPEKIRNFRSGTVFIGGLDPTELVSMEEIERRYIAHVLEAVNGNQTQAARILGLDRKTLYRKTKHQAD